MKSPSTNIPDSLRGQGSSTVMKTPRVSRQTPETAAGRVIPGESGSSPAVGRPEFPNASEYAGATGGHFGNGKVTR